MQDCSASNVVLMMRMMVMMMMMMMVMMMMITMMIMILTMLPHTKSRGENARLRCKYDDVDHDVVDGGDDDERRVRELFIMI